MIIDKLMDIFNGGDNTEGGEPEVWRNERGETYEEQQARLAAEEAERQRQEQARLEAERKAQEEAQQQAQQEPEATTPADTGDDTFNIFDDIKNFFKQTEQARQDTRNQVFEQTTEINPETGIRETKSETNITNKPEGWSDGNRVFQTSEEQKENTEGNGPDIGSAMAKGWNNVFNKTVDNAGEAANGLQFTDEEGNRKFRFEDHDYKDQDGDIYDIYRDENGNAYKVQNAGTDNMIIENLNEGNGQISAINQNDYDQLANDINQAKQASENFWGTGDKNTFRQYGINNNAFDETLTPDELAAVRGNNSIVKGGNGFSTMENFFLRPSSKGFSDTDINLFNNMIKNKDQFGNAYYSDLMYQYDPSLGNVVDENTGQAVDLNAFSNDMFKNPMDVTQALQNGQLGDVVNNLTAGNLNGLNTITGTLADAGYKVGSFKPEKSTYSSIASALSEKATEDTKDEVEKDIQALKNDKDLAQSQLNTALLSAALAQANNGNPANVNYLTKDFVQGNANNEAKLNRIYDYINAYQGSDNPINYDITGGRLTYDDSGEDFEGSYDLSRLLQNTAPNDLEISQNGITSSVAGGNNGNSYLNNDAILGALKLAGIKRKK